MEVRMKKFLAAAAILVAAVGPAYSGPKGDTVNQLQKQQDEIQKRENKDVDKAYNQMLKGTRGDAKPYDPWGSVRPTDGTKKADGSKK
jgi:hypothetical protein